MILLSAVLMRKLLLRPPNSILLMALELLLSSRLEQILILS